MTQDQQREGPYWTSSIDQQIGSLLERWYTRDTAGYCRFCAVEQPDDDEQFCSDECNEAFDDVVDARIAIGKRDLDQRGYD